MTDYSQLQSFSFSINGSYALYSNLLLTWIPQTQVLYDDNLEYLQIDPLTFSNCGHKKIKKIACNSDICHAITEEGLVYSWGNDTKRKGLLGMGENYLIKIPLLNKGLSNARIKDISLSETHACAMDYKFNIYTWGDGAYGKIGPCFKDKDKEHNVPMKVIFNTPFFITKIECGKNYTVGINDQFKVFYFGKINNINSMTRRYNRFCNMKTGNMKDMNSSGISGISGTSNSKLYLYNDNVSIVNDNDNIDVCLLNLDEYHNNTNNNSLNDIDNTSSNINANANAQSNINNSNLNLNTTNTNINIDYSGNIYNKAENIFCGEELFAITTTNGSLFLFNELQGLYKVKFKENIIQNNNSNINSILNNNSANNLPIPFISNVKFINRNFYATTQQNNTIYEFINYSDNRKGFDLYSYAENKYLIDPSLHVTMLKMPYYVKVVFFTMSSTIYQKEKYEKKFLNLFNKQKFSLNNNLSNLNNNNVNNINFSNTGTNFYDPNTNNDNLLYNNTFAANNTFNTTNYNTFNNNFASTNPSNYNSKINKICSMLGNLFEKKIETIMNNNKISSERSQNSLLAGKKKIELIKIDDQYINTYLKYKNDDLGNLTNFNNLESNENNNLSSKNKEFNKLKNRIFLSKREDIPINEKKESNSNISLSLNEENNNFSGYDKNMNYNMIDNFPSEKFLYLNYDLNDLNKVDKCKHKSPSKLHYTKDMKEKGNKLFNINEEEDGQDGDGGNKEKGNEERSGRKNESRERDVWRNRRDVTCDKNLEKLKRIKRGSSQTKNNNKINEGFDDISNVIDNLIKKNKGEEAFDNDTKGAGFNPTSKSNNLVPVNKENKDNNFSKVSGTKTEISNDKVHGEKNIKDMIDSFKNEMIKDKGKYKLKYKNQNDKIDEDDDDLMESKEFMNKLNKLEKDIKNKNQDRGSQLKNEDVKAQGDLKEREGRNDKKLSKKDINEKNRNNIIVNKSNDGENNNNSNNNISTIKNKKIIGASEKSNNNLLEQPHEANNTDKNKKDNDKIGDKSNSNLIDIDKNKNKNQGKDQNSKNINTNIDKNKLNKNTIERNLFKEIQNNIKNLKNSVSDESEEEEEEESEESEKDNSHSNTNNENKKITSDKPLNEEKNNDPRNKFSAKEINNKSNKLEVINNKRNLRGDLKNENNILKYKNNKNLIKEEYKGNDEVSMNKNDNNNLQELENKNKNKDISNKELNKGNDEINMNNLPDKNTRLENIVNNDNPSEGDILDRNRSSKNKLINNEKNPDSGYLNKNELASNNKIRGKDKLDNNNNNNNNLNTKAQRGDEENILGKDSDYKGLNNRPKKSNKNLINNELDNKCVNEENNLNFKGSIKNTINQNQNKDLLTNKEKENIVDKGKKGDTNNKEFKGENIESPNSKSKKVSIKQSKNSIINQKVEIKDQNMTNQDRIITTDKPNKLSSEIDPSCINTNNLQNKKDKEKIKEKSNISSSSSSISNKPLSPSQKQSSKNTNLKQKNDETKKFNIALNNKLEGKNKNTSSTDELQNNNNLDNNNQTNQEGLLKNPRHSRKNLNIEADADDRKKENKYNYYKDNKFKYIDNQNSIENIDMFLKENNLMKNTNIEDNEIKEGKEIKENKNKLKIINVANNSNTLKRSVKKNKAKNEEENTNKEELNINNSLKDLKNDNKLLSSNISKNESDMVDKSKEGTKNNVNGKDRVESILNDASGKVNNEDLKDGRKGKNIIKNNSSNEENEINSSSEGLNKLNGENRHHKHKHKHYEDSKDTPGNNDNKSDRKENDKDTLNNSIKEKNYKDKLLNNNCEETHNSKINEVSKLNPNKTSKIPSSSKNVVNDAFKMRLSNSNQDNSQDENKENINKSFNNPSKEAINKNLGNNNEKNNLNSQNPSSLKQNKDNKEIKDNSNKDKNKDLNKVRRDTKLELSDLSTPNSNLNNTSNTNPSKIPSNSNVNMNSISNVYAFDTLNNNETFKISTNNFVQDSQFLSKIKSINNNDNNSLSDSKEDSVSNKNDYSDSDDQDEKVKVINDELLQEQKEIEDAKKKMKKRANKNKNFEKIEENEHENDIDSPDKNSNIKYDINNLKDEDEINKDSKNSQNFLSPNEKDISKSQNKNLNDKLTNIKNNPNYDLLKTPNANLNNLNKDPSSLNENVHNSLHEPNTEIEHIQDNTIEDQLKNDNFDTIVSTASINNNKTNNYNKENSNNLSSSNSSNQKDKADLIRPFKANTQNLSTFPSDKLIYINNKEFRKALKENETLSTVDKNNLFSSNMEHINKIEDATITLKMQPKELDEDSNNTLVSVIKNMNDFNGYNENVREIVANSTKNIFEMNKDKQINKTFNVESKPTHSLFNKNNAGGNNMNNNTININISNSKNNKSLNSSNKDDAYNMSNGINDKNILTKFDKADKDNNNLLISNFNVFTNNNQDNNDDYPIGKGLNMDDLKSENEDKSFDSSNMSSNANNSKVNENINTNNPNKEKKKEAVYIKIKSKEELLNIINQNQDDLDSDKSIYCYVDKDIDINNLTDIKEEEDTSLLDSTIHALKNSQVVKLKNKKVIQCSGNDAENENFDGENEMEDIMHDNNFISPVKNGKFNVDANSNSNNSNNNKEKRKVKNNNVNKNIIKNAKHNDKEKTNNTNTNTNTNINTNNQPQQIFSHGNNKIIIKSITKNAPSSNPSNIPSTTSHHHKNNIINQVKKRNNQPSENTVNTTTPSQKFQPSSTKNNQNAQLPQNSYDTQFSKAQNNNSIDNIKYFSPDYDPEAQMYSKTFTALDPNNKNAQNAFNLKKINILNANQKQITPSNANNTRYNQNNHFESPNKKKRHLESPMKPKRHNFTTNSNTVQNSTDKNDKNVLKPEEELSYVILAENFHDYLSKKYQHDPNSLAKNYYRSEQEEKKDEEILIKLAKNEIPIEDERLMNINCTMNMRDFLIQNVKKLKNQQRQKNNPNRRSKNKKSNASNSKANLEENGNMINNIDPLKSNNLFSLIQLDYEDDNESKDDSYMLAPIELEKSNMGLNFRKSFVDSLRKSNNDKVFCGQNGNGDEVKKNNLLGVNYQYSNVGDNVNDGGNYIGGNFDYGNNLIVKRDEA